MNQFSEPVTALLRRCGMLPEDIDFTTMTNLFLGQMRIGIYGGHSSIPMCPTYLSPSVPAATGASVAVAELNDRTIRTGLVTFTAEVPTLEYGDSFPIPGAEYPAPLEDLLYAAAELLEPFCRETDHIVLALPFPLEKTKAGDGQILSFPPTMDVSNWQGVPLVKTFEAELSSRGLTGKHCTLVSSAGAALLGAKARNPAHKRCFSLFWDHGMSSAFALPESAFLKLKSGSNQLTMVDTGAGGLTGVPFGTIDLIMDRDAQSPGHDLLDKMVSLKNLGELYRFTMIKAVEGGQLSYMCGREFLSLRKLDLQTVLRFLAEPTGDNLLANFCRHEPQDEPVATAVAQAILDRSAKLACILLASNLLLTGAGYEEQDPALISLSGAAFSEPLLDAFFRRNVETYITSALGRHVTLFHDPDSILIGGGAAALPGIA